MSQLAKIAKNCLKQLTPAIRSTGVSARKNLDAKWATVYRSVNGLSADITEAEARSIHARLTSINRDLADLGVTGCAPDLLVELQRTINKNYPPPVFVREKAKPTICLKRSK
jgi:hypothetical protein